VIMQHQSLVVPGLLQTSDYPGELAEVKRRRQDRLVSAGPQQCPAVLDEAVLHREVGGPMVADAQPERLTNDVVNDNVTIRVILYDANAHR
jgi:Domain of unknown function (DUF5753)